MDLRVVAFVIVIAALVGLRYWAARRVVNGDGRALWFAFTIPLIGFGVMVWVGLTTLPSNPVAGGLLLALGVLFGGAFVVAVRNASTAVTGATSPDDRVTRISDAFQSYQVLLALVVLFGGLVAVVALIAYGISRT